MIELLRVLIFEPIWNLMLRTDALQFTIRSLQFVQNRLVLGQIE